jgi:hypothetical protein
MVRGRKLKNKFAEELISCLENETNGKYQIFLRYELYLEKLDSHIQESNKKIKEDLEKEDGELRSSLLQQSDIDNSLNYFSDLLYKSILVSIFSYLELKVSEIAEICEAHVSTDKKINNFKKSGRNLGFLEAHLEFINSEIVHIINYEEIALDIKNWKDIRNYIVHHNPTEKLPSQSFLEGNFMRIEYSTLKFLNKQSASNFLTLSDGLISNLADSIEKKYDLVRYLD